MRATTVAYLTEVISQVRAGHLDKAADWVRALQGNPADVGAPGPRMLVRLMEAVTAGDADALVSLVGRVQAASGERVSADGVFPRQIERAFCDEGFEPRMWSPEGAIVVRDPSPPSRTEFRLVIMGRGWWMVETVVGYLGQQLDKKHIVTVERIAESPRSALHGF